MSVLGPDDERRANLLLSQANLLRVRGEFDKAVSLCQEALALAPGDAAACALLGDLYAAQGRPDRALPWLAMAVDAAPENPVYRAKLRRLAAVRQAALERGEIVADDAPPTSEPSPPEAEESAAKDEAPSAPDEPPADRQSQLVRGVWIVCGVIFVLFSLVGGWLLRQGTGQKAESAGGQAAPLSAPTAEPTMLPPASAPPGSPATSSPAAPAPAASPTAGVVLRLPVGVAYLNPATGVALRDAPVPATPASKELLLREALRQAADVSRADVRVKTIEIQLKEPGSARAALRARIGAIDAIKVGSAAPLPEILDLFSLLEWRPDIR